MPGSESNNGVVTASSLADNAGAASSVAEVGPGDALGGDGGGGDYAPGLGETGGADSIIAEAERLLAEQGGDDGESPQFGEPDDGPETDEDDAGDEPGDDDTADPKADPKADAKPAAFTSDDQKRAIDAMLRSGMSVDKIEKWLKRDHQAAIEFGLDLVGPEGDAAGADQPGGDAKAPEQAKAEQPKSVRDAVARFKAAMQSGDGEGDADAVLGIAQAHTAEALAPVLQTMQTMYERMLTLANTMEPVYENHQRSALGKTYEALVQDDAAWSAVVQRGREIAATGRSPDEALRLAAIERMAPLVEKSSRDAKRARDAVRSAGQPAVTGSRGSHQRRALNDDEKATWAAELAVAGKTSDEIRQIVEGQGGAPAKDPPRVNKLRAELAPKNR